MENAGVSKSWRELYREALLEHDPAKLEARIVDAHRAIEEEVRRSWYGRSTDIRERQSLEAASHYLEILRSCSGKNIASRKSA